MERPSVIWKDIQDILLMEKSKEQNNIVFCHLDKHIYAQTEEKNICIIIYMYIHKKLIKLLWGGKLDIWETRT